MVPEDHRLCRQVAGQPGYAGLVRPCQEYSAQLDWPLAGIASSICQSQARARSAFASTRRGQTRSMASRSWSLAPQHPRIGAHRSASTAAVVWSTRKRPRIVGRTAEAGERPMTGVFTGAYAVHPLTGEQVPIWVADYVLVEYGTGAIMGVPAHDERDLSFAHTSGCRCADVVAPTGADWQPESSDVALPIRARWWNRVRSLAWPPNGRRGVLPRMEESGLGERTKTYHLRDWLISRQRYWGPPIPIIYCPTMGRCRCRRTNCRCCCRMWRSTCRLATGASPLAQIAEFVETTCPICGGPARRETDVSDNFLDSAWYFLRYPSATTIRAMGSKLTRKWLPVDMYIGGAEHSVLHLMYARFITMAMHDLGHLDFEEPFTRFRANGIDHQGGREDEQVPRQRDQPRRVYRALRGRYLPHVSGLHGAVRGGRRLQRSWHRRCRTLPGARLAAGHIARRH